MSNDIPKKLPIPLFKPMPAATEVPLADLGPLTEPVRALALTVQVPHSMALSAILGALAVSVQGLINVRSVFGETPVCLAIVSIADSGDRKSSVDKRAMKAVREFERPLLRKYRKELEAFEAQSAGPPILEDEGGKPEGGNQEPPISPQILYEDITYQGLMNQLRHARPSFGVFSDEGGKLLNSYGMQSSRRTESIAAFSQLWDGKDIDIARKGSGSLFLPGRRGTLSLSVQPLVIKKLFNDEEVRSQGFLSRLLITWSESLKGTRLYRTDPEAVRRKVEAEAILRDHDQRITELLKTELPLFESGSLELSPRVLELDDGANKMLIDHYNFLEEELGSSGLYANISGWASKAHEQATRIAGILAMYEDPEVKLVTVETMKVALRITEFFLKEALRILDTGYISQQMEEADQLLQWLQTKWTEDLIDVQSAVRFGPNQLRDTKRIRSLLKTLEEFEWLESLSGSHRIKDAKSNRAFRIVRVGRCSS